MATTYRGVDAKCPFYIQDSAKTIHCEGLSEGETIRRKFDDEVLCTRTFRGSCCGRYNECPVYKMITEIKYNDRK